MSEGKKKYKTKKSPPKESLSELKKEREKILKKMEELKGRYVEITKILIKKEKEGGEK